MVIIAYLNNQEFIELGFDEVDNFEKLEKRAEIAINLFINNFYDTVDFDKEITVRKKAVKLATAFQVAYLESSGITTADDKQSVASVTVGRTSVSYRDATQLSVESARYNLSQDALNALKQAGFGYRGVNYDRY